MDPTQLRIQALQIAQQIATQRLAKGETETTDETVARAQAYLAFLEAGGTVTVETASLTVDEGREAMRDTGTTEPVA